MHEFRLRLQRVGARLLPFRQEHSQNKYDHYNTKNEFASCLSLVFWLLFNLQGLVLFRQLRTPVPVRFSPLPSDGLCTKCIERHLYGTVTYINN